MKILVLLDGSKWSLKAAMHALMLAKKKRSETEIVMLSVIDRAEIKSAAFYLCRQSDMCDMISEHETRIWRDTKKNISSDISELTLAFNKEEIECTSKIVEGKRTEEIIKEINSDSYNLIVMGAFGKKSNVHVGSLYSQIAEDSDVPILTIN